jgi:hypothetical protein
VDHIYFSILMLLAGVSAGIGLLFLFIGLRRSLNVALHRTFSIFALCYAGAIAGGGFGIPDEQRGWLYIYKPYGCGIRHWGIYIPVVFCSQLL